MTKQPSRSKCTAALLIACAFAGTASVFADDVSVTALSLANQPAANAKINTSFNGAPLTVGGKKMDAGLGTSANSKIVINLDRAATHFKASVAIDDETPAPAAADGQAAAPIAPSANVAIYGDDRRLWPAGAAGGGGRGGRGRILTAGGAIEDVDIDLTGVRVLSLEITPPPRPQGRRGGAAPAAGHVDWINPVITFNGTKPETPVLPAEEKAILTPKEAATPRINGAKVFGVRPGHPFMFTVATTGQRPIEFSADGLPDGLTMDPATGFISGKISATGDHVVKLHAKNALGSADGTLKIVVGDTINLTPQLGWNSWNCFGPAVTADNVKAAADAMVSSGLINHGWTYINTDDYWENSARNPDPLLHGAARADDGTINSNGRFPSMKDLADYIHSKGLKAGLYSSPGPTTCGGCTGSYQHEEQDVNTWASWGFDYIKYDWCSYGNTPEGRGNTREVAIAPYKLLGDALKKANRDIVFSLCQYGNQNVWEWGADIGGNSWRTTGDITDTWASLTSIWDSQTERPGRGGMVPTNMAKYAGPGHWNDADMMIVGQVSVASGQNFHATNLTPNEQYTHVTAWILMACPMLIGCDMTKFDDFTLNLLTNDEVLAVSQDPLGKAATRLVDKVKAGGFEVWAKDMEDGSKAVGIFNRSELEGKYTLELADVGLSGKQSVRDLWQQKDVATADGKYEVSVPRHGVLLLKLSAAK